MNWCSERETEWAQSNEGFKYKPEMKSDHSSGGDGVLPKAGPSLKQWSFPLWYLPSQEARRNCVWNWTSKEKLNTLKAWFNLKV